MVFSVNLFVSCVTAFFRSSFSLSSQDKSSLFLMYCLVLFFENISLDLGWEVFFKKKERKHITGLDL